MASVREEAFVPGHADCSDPDFVCVYARIHLPECPDVEYKNPKEFAVNENVVFGTPATLVECILSHITETLEDRSALHVVRMTFKGSSQDLLVGPTATQTWHELGWTCDDRMELELETEEVAGCQWHPNASWLVGPRLRVHFDPPHDWPLAVRTAFDDSALCSLSLESTPVAISSFIVDHFFTPELRSLDLVVTRMLDTSQLTRPGCAELLVSGTMCRCWRDLLSDEALAQLEAEGTLTVEVQAVVEETNWEKMLVAINSLTRQLVEAGVAVPPLPPEAALLLPAQAPATAPAAPE